MKDFQAGVGLSRSWDPKKAGEEVAVSTLEKLDKDPKFFLLFSTIHYDKEKNGMQKFVEAVYDQLPKGTPMIGGTVAGFMNPYGCYARGATGLAVSYPDMDVAVGVGHNTKRNPKKAASECAKMIKKGLKDSKYKNKYFINFISSAAVPNIPIISGRKVIRDIKGLNFLLAVFDRISPIMQIGCGRDDVVIKSFSEMLPDYEGIGGASCDNLSLEKNYQYYLSDVMTNSIVSIGLSINQKLKSSMSLGLNPTGKKLFITDTSQSGYIVNKINGKPAVEEYLNVMGWSEDILDERLYRKVFYYPLIQTVKNKKEPRMFGLVYGDSFVFPMKPPKMQELEICTSSGKDLLDSYSELFEKKPYNAGFMISCGTRLETLGNKIFTINEKILNKSFIGDYLLLYTAGEYMKKSQENALSMYQSNVAILF